MALRGIISPSAFFSEELGVSSEKFNLFVDEWGYNVDDIHSVTYFEDVFELENNRLVFRHIDIDFINGEFLEINDNDIRYKKLMDIFSINETDLKDGQIFYKKINEEQKVKNTSHF